MSIGRKSFSPWIESIPFVLTPHPTLPGHFPKQPLAMNKFSSLRCFFFFPFSFDCSVLWKNFNSKLSSGKIWVGNFANLRLEERWMFLMFWHLFPKFNGIKVGSKVTRHVLQKLLVFWRLMIQYFTSLL